MKPFLLLALACFVGCSAADPLPPPPSDGAAPVGDAGPTSDTHTSDVAPDAEPSSDATPDAGTPGEDGAADALPPPGADAGHHDASDGAPTQEGGADGGARSDAIDATAADRVVDVMSTADAISGGDVRDGGDGGLVCQAEPAQCTNAQKAADAIATTFAGRTCTGTETKCGGVLIGGVTATYPLVCSGGTWVYAWCVTAVCYTCSVGCAAGQLCGP